MTFRATTLRGLCRWLPCAANEMLHTFSRPSALVRDRLPCTYILASAPRGTLYIGVTSDLAQRVWQHRNDFVPGFTSRYQIHQLVWFESHPAMEAAITREKHLKAWKRLWKIQLIESMNPDWRDLYPDLT